MPEKFEVDIVEPVPSAGPPPGPLDLDELPQPGAIAAEQEEKRALTLEEVAKLHRNGQRVEHQFHPAEVKAEIVRQIQERVSRK